MCKCEKEGAYKMFLLLDEKLNEELIKYSQKGALKETTYIYRLREELQNKYLSLLERSDNENKIHWIKWY